MTEELRGTRHVASASSKKMSSGSCPLAELGDLLVIGSPPLIALSKIVGFEVWP